MEEKDMEAKDIEKTPCEEIDYKREYEILTFQLHCANEKIEMYRQALLNVCRKM